MDDLDLGLMREHLKEVGSDLYGRSESMDLLEVAQNMHLVAGPPESLRPLNVGLYLFEDAAKTKKPKVFSIRGNPTYSDICDDFRARGELAFKGMKELAPVDGGQGEEAEEPDDADGEA